MDMEIRIITPNKGNFDILQIANKVVTNLKKYKLK